MSPPYGSASSSTVVAPVAARAAASSIARVERPGAPLGPHTEITAPERPAGRFTRGTGRTGCAERHASTMTPMPAVPSNRVAPRCSRTSVSSALSATPTIRMPALLASRATSESNHPGAPTEMMASRSAERIVASSSTLSTQRMNNSTAGSSTKPDARAASASGSPASVTTRSTSTRSSSSSQSSPRSSRIRRPRR